jgi:hypothetical protein
VSCLWRRLPLANVPLAISGGPVNCPHHFFLKDLAFTYEGIRAEVGDDWRVICEHCGQSVAGSRSFKSEPIVIRWRKSRAWFGEFTVEDPDRGTAP